MRQEPRRPVYGDGPPKSSPLKLRRMDCSKLLTLQVGSSRIQQGQIKGQQLSLLCHGHLVPERLRLLCAL